MRRYRLAIVAVLAHLALATAGAADVSLARFGVVGAALYRYGLAAGAMYRFAFFAPGVGSDVRAEVDVLGPHGERQTEAIEPDLNREAWLRVADLYEQFLSKQFVDPVRGRNDRLYRSLAASLSGTVLGRHPEATDAVFRLEQYNPPSSAAYRDGQRGRWQPVYTARFHTLARQQAAVP